MRAIALSETKGMTGFDGIHALLKIVRADLSVKWKKIHDNTRNSARELIELAEAKLAEAFAPKQAFLFA